MREYENNSNILSILVIVIVLSMPGKGWDRNRYKQIYHSIYFYIGKYIKAAMENIVIHRFVLKYPNFIINNDQMREENISIVRHINV